MKFSQITARQEVELERSIVQNYEQKFIEAAESLRLNRAVLRYWKERKATLGRGVNNPMVNQAIASAESSITKGAIEIAERELGHPMLVARLEELTAIADAEDAKREAEDAAKAQEKERDEAALALEAGNAEEGEYTEDGESATETGAFAEVDEAAEAAVTEATEIVHEAPVNGKSHRARSRELALV